MSQSFCELQVGFAGGAATEAAALVERSRARLRAVASAVAKEHRPRVLSLESVEPLVLGEVTIGLLSNCAQRDQCVNNALLMR